jgi:hypothetical protein
MFGRSLPHGVAFLQMDYQNAWFENASSCQAWVKTTVATTLANTTLRAWSDGVHPSSPCVSCEELLNVEEVSKKLDGYQGKWMYPRSSIDDSRFLACCQSSTTLPGVYTADASGLYTGMDPVWSWASADFRAGTPYQKNDSRCTVPKNKYVCSLDVMRDSTYEYQWGDSTADSPSFFDDNSSSTADLFPIYLPMPDGSTGMASLNLVNAAVPPAHVTIDDSSKGGSLPDKVKPILRGPTTGYGYFMSVITNMTVEIDGSIVSVAQTAPFGFCTVYSIYSYCMVS